MEIYKAYQKLYRSQPHTVANAMKEIDKLGLDNLYSEYFKMVWIAHMSIRERPYLVRDSHSTRDYYVRVGPINILDDVKTLHLSPRKIERAIRKISLEDILSIWLDPVLISSNGDEKMRRLHNKAERIRNNNNKDKEKI
jgi:hypothetical protein